ncbi:hypothetical protein BABINDRAFT_162739 [Babjeviella inositovora NRRL Y-12698]|uniref:DUF1746 domain-containing protein n=1 Tax=Babjeviella inositovora NRRL Y-12698 TaxID=984486 RepID=A0A1E3QN61_9ASCO|nr:uncharacterized protein BABINDRAFT_162739 [Babjeviella inositovora NRRL Y-12698]ODQ78532.1 hypothetical protein BABINDRAFT_162739 [Babjeviella inositovora NRRL Y-12698]
MEFHDRPQATGSHMLIPTPQEFAACNAQALSDRKHKFRQKLIVALDILILLLFICVYLADLSALKLLIKVGLQFTLADPFPTTAIQNISKARRNRIVQFLMWFTIYANLGLIALHLWHGNRALQQYLGPNEDYVYGGFFIQVIGERVYRSLWMLARVLLWDILAFAAQLVLFSITCVSECVLLPQSEAGEDGYSGRVLIYEINIWENLSAAFNYDVADRESNIPESLFV